MRPGRRNQYGGRSSSVLLFFFVSVSGAAKWLFWGLTALEATQETLRSFLSRRGADEKGQRCSGLLRVPGSTEMRKPRTSVAEEHPVAFEISVPCWLLIYSVAHFYHLRLATLPLHGCLRPELTHGRRCTVHHRPLAALDRPRTPNHTQKQNICTYATTQ